MECDNCGRSYDDHRATEDSYGGERMVCYADEEWQEVELDREAERLQMIAVEGAAIGVLREMMSPVEAFATARRIAQLYRSHSKQVIAEIGSTR